MPQLRDTKASEGGYGLLDLRPHSLEHRPVLAALLVTGALPVNFFMAVNCSAEALAQASAYLKVIPPQERNAVMIYLLAQIVGVDHDAASLMEAAKCLRCIQPSRVETVMVYLLCQIVTAGEAPSETECDAESLLAESACFSCIPGNAAGAVIVSLFCQAVGTPTPPPPDPPLTEGEVLANEWAARVVAAGGAQPAIPTLEKVAAFIDTLMPTTVWAKMKTLNFVAVDGIIAASIPLIGPDWTKVGAGTWIATDLRVTGMRPGTSNRVWNTHINPTAEGMVAGSAGISLYMNSADVAAVAWSECGVWSALGNNLVSYVAYGNSTIWDCWLLPAGRINTAIAAANFVSFFSFNRTSTADQVVYRANSSGFVTHVVAAGQINTGSPVNAEAFAWGTRNSDAAPGTVQQYCQRWMSFLAIHDGLTLAEATTLYNAVQTLRKAFGGGFT